MVTLNWDKTGQIIQVASPNTELTCQELITEVRDWEDELDNMDIYHVAIASGKEELGGGLAVGITLTLLNWKLQFEPRVGPDWIACEVLGGNLVAVSGSGEEIKALSGLTYVNPIEPASYVTVTRTTSVSATTQDITALRTAVYGGTVYINSVTGTSGTDFPQGTLEAAVNNWPEATGIAKEYSIPKITFIEDYVFGETDNLNNWIVCGVNDHVDLTMTSGVSTDRTVFRTCTIHGTLSGGTMGVHECKINGITGLDGTVDRCLFLSDLRLAGTGTVNFLNCYSGVPGGGTPIIDMNESGVTLGVRAYAGGLKLINKSGPESVSLDYIAGQLKLGSTVTSGDIVVRGVVQITEDLSNGANVTWGGSSIEQIINTKKKVLGLY